MSSRWHRIVLTLAGVYNLAWGAFLILAPEASYRFVGLAVNGEALINVAVWQGLGWVIGVFGIGYLLAAPDPVRHWRLVLVGLTSKLLGLIGFIAGALQGRLTWQTAATSFFNDVIWWVPFGLILAHAWRVYRDDVDAPLTETPELALTRFRTQYGTTLAELSQAAPVLLVFLRHLGCSFCKQALADAATRRAAIEAHGRQLAFVHMAEDEPARRLMAKFGLEDVARVSDPDQQLYRSFQLRRSSLLELFKPSAIWRFAQAFRAGHVNGPFVGDGFRLGGVFLIQDGRVVGGKPYADVVDRPDFCEIARPI